MTDHAPKIHCIIVTYNGMQWIDKCLQSLLAEEIKLHIIVVDNASADHTVSHIRLIYPGVQILEAKTNLGFGAANNLGMKIAVKEGADFVFLLNQDAWVAKGCIPALVQAASNHPEYGIISPIHLTGEGTKMDRNFEYYLGESHLNNLLHHLLIENQFNKTSIIDTKFVNAAAWLIPRDCLLKTGGFDPVFFHYGEDRNYCDRAHNKGFKTGILPGAIIYHDRENRSFSPEQATIKKAETEWMNQLVAACDPGNKNWQLQYLRRSITCFINCLQGILTFKWNAVRLNAQYLRKMIIFFAKIKESRRLYASGEPLLYL